MKANKARRVAIEIMDEFEEMLDRKGIMIPSEDREGREEEACIYGTEYYELEDVITDILVEETRPRSKRC
jgi:hypothetical protein